MEVHPVGEGGERPPQLDEGGVRVDGRRDHAVGPLTAIQYKEARLEAREKAWK